MTCFEKYFLIIILCCLACRTETKHDPVIKSQLAYFEATEKNDIKLSAPKPGEWLYDHPEKGQSFEAYQKAKPVKPTNEQSVIYIKPIGNFDTLQLKALRLTRTYVEIFFQLKTVLLPPISDKIVPKNATRTLNDHQQLLAPYILDSLLTNKIPAAGIALMAITAKDLYPKENWNYVFGLASYIKRVGVSSIYRLQDKELTSANFEVCLRRLINIASHEIGHMFTMAHCTFAKCTMNGSNNLSETDLCPNRLCSECQKKLYWNLGYDNQKRLKELIEFCRKNDLLQDFRILEKDLGNSQ